MKVNIDFAQYVATIEFEPFLGDDIKEYQKEFEKWYFVQNKKGCNIKVRPERHYENFDTQVIIDWLNETSPNCKARIIKPFLNPGEEDKSLSYMYF